MLMTRRARPHQVLAVTFTNKAAREMIERVEGLIGQSAQGMWFGTFHAIGVRILRAHAELVGLKSGFTILDTDDQQRLAKQVIQAADLDDRKWTARILVGIIQRWKDRGLKPEQVPASLVGDFAFGRSLDLYKAYQTRLETLNACDFGDLLLHNLTIFQNHEDVLRTYQNRFKAVLVDEYQDTNVAQYLWLRLLAQTHKNITCVGDDDQSIYSWRGAEVGNILKFEQDFPNAQVIRLERNYRSTGHILAAASAVIANNTARHGKTLWTEDEFGDRVRIAGVWDDEEEARFVGEEIEAWQRSGEKLNDCAVLVRAGFQTRAFEERFIQLGLPYRVIGGPRFYERAEIRDAMAYLRLVAQIDDDLAFERIVNQPKRGIGEAAIKKLRTAGRQLQAGLYRTAQNLTETDELPARQKNALLSFIGMVERWRLALRDESPRDLLEMILDESGYTEMWKNDRSPDAPGRIENLKELVKAIEEFETVPGFLEHVGLVMDNASGAEADMASIMTLHGAKGLEFPNVFLAGWEEGLFPSQRAIDDSGQAALEEERRLAYVGMTRARRKLTISFAANRRMYGQWSTSIPSRFVEELPDDHVDHLYRNPTTRPDTSLYFDDAPYLRTSRMPNQGGGFNDRRSRRAPTIDGNATLISSKPTTTHSFAQGDRVFHDKFGYGAVAEIEGNKLTITFEKSGTKKVIASFLQPAPPKSDG